MQSATLHNFELERLQSLDGIAKAVFSPSLKPLLTAALTDSSSYLGNKTGGKSFISFSALNTVAKIINIDVDIK